MGRPKGSKNKSSIDANAFSDPDLLFTCSTCGVPKPSAEFYKDAANNNGLRGDCKKCHVAKNTTPEALEKNKLYNRRRRQKDIRQYLYDAAKHRAKKNGLPFSIIVDDIYVPKFCPVFGILLEVNKGHPKPNSPSLDRIKPELGYVPGNIKVICDRANRIKSNATIKELEALIRFLKSFENYKLTREPTTVKVYI